MKLTFFKPNLPVPKAVDPNTYSAQDVRIKLTEMLDKISTDNQMLSITKNNKEVAVILSRERLIRLIEEAVDEAIIEERQDQQTRIKLEASPRFQELIKRL